jgi:hypothetical protein
MGSEYTRNSPSAGLLNVGQMGNTPTYSGGSQTGSEYNFGNTNSPSLDSIMSGNAHRFTTSTLPDHRNNLPVHNYGGAYDATLYNTNAVGGSNNVPQHQSPDAKGDSTQVKVLETIQQRRTMVSHSTSRDWAKTRMGNWTRTWPFQLGVS